ncbi:MAG TPA: DUF502 domain-containing protein [Gammaproteobacteria bacterium]|nr:DUF502 domain-containing protein [Gammaproteobacteria bacterium]
MQARTRKEDAIKKLGNLFLQGLIAVLPVVATLAILFWLGVYTEAFLGGIIKLILPVSWYWPGMGFLMGVVVVFIVGLFVDAYIFQRFGEITEGILLRIPIVKTIYNGIRDIAHFLTPSEERKEIGNPVLVRLTDDMRVIGFVTGTQMPYECEEESVAVYMPMSYQIGGYTIYIPRSRIEPLNMPVEQAMRMVLTAGMSEFSKNGNGKNGNGQNGQTKK